MLKPTPHAGGTVSPASSPKGLGALWSIASFPMDKPEQTSVERSSPGTAQQIDKELISSSLALCKLWVECARACEKSYLRIKPVVLVLASTGFAPSPALGCGGHSPSPSPAARETFQAWRMIQKAQPQKTMSGRERSQTTRRNRLRLAEQAAPAAPDAPAGWEAF